MPSRRFAAKYGAIRFLSYPGPAEIVLKFRAVSGTAWKMRSPTPPKSAKVKIRRGIVDSDVIVAEITPVNANVFYELGYAHALEKPTILLANRNTEKLPFDISGYRVIFYDDSIRGKRDIEATLRKHL